MNVLILILVGVLAVAFIYESTKGKSKPTSGDGASAGERDADDNYISADDAEPTSTGRYRAIQVKKLIQKGREGEDESEPEVKKPKKQLGKQSTHQSMAHETVDDASSDNSLPDPFDVELQDDQKE